MMLRQRYIFKQVKRNLLVVLLISFVSLIFFDDSFAAEVARVVTAKGSVLLDEVPTQEGQRVNEGSTLVTGKSSLAKLKLKDQTIVTLGQESEFLVKAFKEINKKRQNKLHLLKGKMRVLVNERAKEGEKIDFITGQIVLGVRGTEFLVNSSQLGGAPSSDVLLIKGSLRAAGPGFNAFDLSPGQYFNSQELMRSGMSAVKTLSRDLLNQIKESSDLFLPDLKTSAGLTNLSSALAAALAPVEIGAGALGPLALLPQKTKASLAGAKRDQSKDKNEMVSLSKKSEKNKEKKKLENPSKVQGVLNFKYNLKNEKWDIRDAVMNHQKNKENNRCFYYFYKPLPGGGEPERFRRERDCDEFDYDL